MRVLSFLTRDADPVMTAAEAKALRAQAATAAALASDLARDLERMIARVDFLARQVRELAGDARAQDARPPVTASRDVEAFFVDDRQGSRP